MSEIDKLGVPTGFAVELLIAARAVIAAGRPERNTMNKEQIYDAHIHGLMAQVIDICKTHGIAMFATFNIPNDDDPDMACTTQLPDETGELPERILECARAGGTLGAPMLMLTTQHADGRKTITAVLP